MDEMSMTLTNQDSLSAWLEYIAGIHVSAIDMGLERVLPVAKKLGVLKQDLIKKPYVFTVAGTNGKGSTTATISAICQAAGFKVALYQSPHLVSFTERIMIDGQGVDETSLVNALATVERVRIECGLTLSFFEMTTLAAFSLLKGCDCDVWVLEIGLGGRLDVVNIIDPDVAVITNIGIDHVDWLSDDIEKIGLEKAGIIRDGIPVILGARHLPQSVHQSACDNAGKVYQFGVDYDFCDKKHEWYYSSSGVTLKLPKPKLSLLNAVNGVSACLASSLNISQDDIADGLNGVVLAGRFDDRMIAGRQWLFDVAHNAHGMVFLLDQFIPYWKNHVAKNSHAKLHVVFSMLGDKDIGAVFDLIQDALNDECFLIEHWHIAVINHPRAMGLADILSLMKAHLIQPKIASYESLYLASLGAIQFTKEQDMILVFGSFHTVGETLIALLGKPY